MPLRDGPLRCLLLQAGADVFGVRLDRVRRVIPTPRIHPLPGAAAALAGLTEYQGEPLPVLDLGHLVSASPGAQATYPVMAVVLAGVGPDAELVGLQADAALEIVEVPTEAIAASAAELLTGEVDLGGRIVAILDLEQLGGRR